MADPDILARLEALEQRQLALGDLPLRALQDKLELDWQPNSSLLIPPASITQAMLADYIQPKFIAGGAATGNVNSGGVGTYVAWGPTFTVPLAGVYRLISQPIYMQLQAAALIELRCAWLKNGAFIGALSALVGNFTFSAITCPVDSLDQTLMAGDVMRLGYATTNIANAGSFGATGSAAFVYRKS